MCHITKLHCEVCQTDLRHLFLPCESFLSENVRDENGTINNHIEPGKRFYCSDLKWPLDPNEDISHWVCNTCFEFGRQSYKASIKFVEALQDEKASDSCNLRLLRGQLQTNNDELNTPHNTGPGLGHLPIGFSNMASREGLLSLYDSKAFPDHLWEERVASSASCCLTVWMPCCPVCKDPLVDPRKGGGIVDVEFEPTSELWRWLALNQKLAPEEIQAFEITVATGFIAKVCQICCNLETALRAQVYNYLQDTTRPRSWAVCTWLLARGVVDRPFYDVTVMNLGFPDTMPPPSKEIMGLMTNSWKRLTNGLAFGDCVVDSSPPVSYPAPMTRHQEPLVCLDQWARLIEPRSDKKLNINHPPPPLDSMLSDPSIASWISNMRADDQPEISHTLRMDTEDDGGTNGEEASDKGYIGGPGVNSVDAIDDDDSVSSDTSYTSYTPPDERPKFNFLPEKPRVYTMEARAYLDPTNFRICDDGYGDISTTCTLERIAIGSVDPIIALWHMLGKFIRTLQNLKAKKQNGHLKADWQEAHEWLGIIVKFAATVREHRKTKYKAKSLCGGGICPRKVEKVLETFLKDVMLKKGHKSELVDSDISEVPIDVVAFCHQPISDGLLDLYMPEISFNEGEGESLIATVKGIAICNGEWITQRYRLHKRNRQVRVWKFTAPDFEESFAAAAQEGSFVNVMRRSLFGEKTPGRMNGSGRRDAHSSMRETPDRDTRSMAKAKGKEAQKGAALFKGNRSPTQKHVHFASSPDLVEEAESTKPWWEIGQGEAGPSGQNRPHDSASDDDAPMADADVTDLDDGQGAFVLCNQGGWHYHDVFGSPMGEQISLPGLGLELID